MSISSNYELSSNDESDFISDEDSTDFDTPAVDFDFEENQSSIKASKRDNKRGYDAKRKIEQLKEEQRLRKLLEDDYDDWD